MENSSNLAGKADEVTKVIASKPGSEATIPLINKTASPQPKPGVPVTPSAASNQKESNQSQTNTQATQQVKPASQPANQQAPAPNQPKAGAAQPQQSNQATPPPSQASPQPNQAKPAANQAPQGGNQGAPQPNNQANQPKPAGSQPAAPPKPSLSSLFNDNKKTTKRNIVAGVLGASFLAGTLAIMGYTTKEDEISVPITPGPINPQDANALIDTNTITPARFLLNTEQPISTKHNDEIPFEDAKALAREEMGQEGFFIHEGKIHPTMNEDEWNAKLPEEKLDYLKQINVTPQPERPLEIEIPDGQGGTVQVVLPMLSENLRMSFAIDSNGDVFYIDNQGNSTHLSNLSVDEYGSLVRTDPDTGEINYVTPSAIFEEINDHGSVHVTTIIPDIIDPIDEGVYMWGPVQSWDFDGEPREGQGWGWDTSGDGVIDQIDYGMPVDWIDEIPEPEPIFEPIDPVQSIPTVNQIDETPEAEKTDNELLQARIAEIAKDAGIEDITKIKIHETDEGWSVKIKGDDGEKVKTEISKAELHEAISIPTDNHIPVGTLVDDDVDREVLYHPLPPEMDGDQPIVTSEPVEAGDDSQYTIDTVVEGGIIVDEENSQSEYFHVQNEASLTHENTNDINRYEQTQLQAQYELELAQNEPMNPDDGLNVQDNNADLTYSDQNYVDPNQ